MGTFIGHISPGLAFLSFGLFYAARYTWMVLSGCREQYPPRIKKPGNILKSLPVEGVMKLIYGLMAVLAEFFFPPGVYKLQFFASDDPNYHFQHANEWQHATMYVYFCFSGVLDIVSQTCLKQRWPLLEHLGVTAAFFITTLLLKFHSHGKDMIEVQVHYLLLITCGFTCVIFIIEIWLPNQPKLWFSKAWLVLVQGTWLFHAAFILFNPPTGHNWNSEDHFDLMFLVTFYCWHLAFNVGVICAIFWITSLLHRRWGGKINRNGYHLAGEMEKLTGVEDEEL